MEIREMRAFVVVEEEGGLSAAARRLHLSQSALSEEFVAREARWAAVAESSPGRDTAEVNAAAYVFDLLIDWDLARTGYNTTTAGVTTVKDVAGMARSLDIGEGDLRRHPLSFVDKGNLIVPWETKELIVRRAAQRKPVVLLADVEKDEQEFRQRAMHGGDYVCRVGASSLSIWRLSPSSRRRRSPMVVRCAKSCVDGVAQRL